MNQTDQTTKCEEKFLWNSLYGVMQQHNHIYKKILQHENGEVVFVCQRCSKVAVFKPEQLT